MKTIKKFAKNIFKPNRMKMAALMLLCGTAVTFAQNAAGDYTAGTNVPMWSSCVMRLLVLLP